MSEVLAERDAAALRQRPGVGGGFAAVSERGTDQGAAGGIAGTCGEVGEAPARNGRPDDSDWFS